MLNCIGVKGEEYGLSTRSSPLWLLKPVLPKYTPLTWYKITFSAPLGNSPVTMEFTGMQKGQAWINGQSIGRYWPVSIANVDAKRTSSCNYRGSYDQNKCLAGCGKPTQQYYHVPRSRLKPSGNVLVMMEEIGGDPTSVSLATREIGPTCARVSESFPAPIDSWNSNHLQSNKPTLSLECPSPNQVISELQFVSFEILMEPVEALPKVVAGANELGVLSIRLALEKQDAVLKSLWRILVTLVQMLQRVQLNKLAVLENRNHCMGYSDTI